MKKSLIIALVAVLIAGCAGTKFNWDHARQLQVGMTEAEVVQLLGKPYGVTTRGDQQIWVWSYANGMTGSTQSLAVPMKDGKVISVPKIPDSFK